MILLYKNTIPLMFVSTTLLCLSPSAAAYETVEVQHGGVVSGTVTLNGRSGKTGKARFPKNLNGADRTFCGARRPLVTPYYRVGKAGKLADVMVWLDGVTRGKRRARAEGLLANRGCRFVPLVQTLDVGAKVLVTNEDPILHTTHPIYSETRVTAFNVAMPKKGQRAKKRIRRPGLMRVQCDAGHVWMRAWVRAFSHPYHTVTGADGRFELAAVPPGTYTLRAWHERAGSLSRKVTVSADGKLRLDLTLKAR